MSSKPGFLKPMVRKMSDVPTLEVGGRDVAEARETIPWLKREGDQSGEPREPL